MTNNKYNIKVRLNRSELAVPGSKIDFFEKAARSDADIIFLDLEDSVSINQKSNARANVIEAVNDIDWRDKTLSVRVNSYNTKFIHDDIEEIMKNTSSRLDLLMFPKVRPPSFTLIVEMNGKKLLTTMFLKENLVRPGKNYFLLAFILKTPKDLISF